MPKTRISLPTCEAKQTLWTYNNMIRFDRLRKLAQHLKEGKLGHDKFDFSSYGHKIRSEESVNCGTAGCAMGECPAVFPRQWEWNNIFLPRLKAKSKNGFITMFAGMDFFRLDEDQYGHLFTPARQDTDIYGGEFLLDLATKDQVADNILAFCDKFEPVEA